MSYEAVDVSLVEPGKRDYSSGKAKAAQVPRPGPELKSEDREERWTKDAKVREGESFKVIGSPGPQASPATQCSRK